MYLERLDLSHVKLFGEFQLDLRGSDGAPRMWTVLVGDNATGKTTLLQAVALAASGEKLARALVDDAADFADLTAPGASARIAADFVLADGPLQVALTLEPGRHAFTGDAGAERLDELRDRRTPGHFVAGYGVGRRLPRRGEVAVARDPFADRVRGLFDSHHKVLGVDFFEALSAQGREQRLAHQAPRALGGDVGDPLAAAADAPASAARAYASALRDLLVATDAEGVGLLPGLANVELRGKGGLSTMQSLLEGRRFVFQPSGGTEVRLPPHLLSSGYQSTFAWLADLLGQGFVDAGGPIDAATLAGVVLLDELDLHLHPSWQRRIVPILRAAFPRLQFIVTTHSPLVLASFEEHEIVRLGFEDGRITGEVGMGEPATQTATQILTRYFDVPRAAAPAVVVQQRQLRSGLTQLDERGAGNARSAIASGAMSARELEEQLDAIRLRLAALDSEDATP